jgi:FkbM family methyltransferase
MERQAVVESNPVVLRIRKALYRRIRYHWLTERAQHLVRRNNKLKMPAIELELKVEPGSVMIDCGANVGDVSSLFARAGATVYAFEPHPVCYSILSKRFRAMPMVHCFNKGVMDKRCTMLLRTPAPHGGWDAIEMTVSASFMPDAFAADEHALQKTEVECIDLDQFVRSLNDRVRLLKLDIEGSEVQVINRLMDTGAIELIDLMLVETHERHMPNLLEATNALRARIHNEGLKEKIRLDWY